MKREQKVLVGLLAAILAGALVLAGCENPAGPKGDKGDPGDAASNAQKEQLATYGFTFGNPVHTVKGRADVYAGAIYSKTAIAGITATNVAAAKAAVHTLTTGKIVVKNGKRAVQFGVTGGETWNDFITAFNTAVGSGGGQLEGGITADLVAHANGLGANNFAFKVTVPTTNSITIEFVTNTGDAALLFGASSTGFTIGGGTITTIPIIAGLIDTWTIPVITKVTADNTAGDTVSVPATVTFNGKGVFVPAALTAQTISNTVFSQLEAEKAFAGYHVTNANPGYIVVSAWDYDLTSQPPVPHPVSGEGTLTADKLVPTFTGFNLTYGYDISFTHAQTGKPSVIVTADRAKQVFEGTAGNTVIAAGNVLTIKADDIWDTTIFTDAIPAGALTTGNVYSANVSSKITVGTSGGKLTLTSIAYADNYISAVGAQALGGAGGTTTPGKADAYDAGADDIWTLNVVLANGTTGPTSALIPVKASKVTFNANITNIALVEAGYSKSDIETSVGTALTAGNTGYVYSPGIYTKVTSATPTFSSGAPVTATIGEQY
ncbi:hypothetical protein FACS1894190_06390 [Spirochaetia bacterium]|nr:hypothetical protein FACS1894190_06390 [Spirochaetia bacterium]